MIRFSLCSAGGWVLAMMRGLDQSRSPMKLGSGRLCSDLGIRATLESLIWQAFSGCCSARHINNSALEWCCAGNPRTGTLKTKYFKASSASDCNV